MSYSDSFPAQRASFMADFANAGRLDSRISFTRASTGTFFGTDKVLSSENLLAYSSDLSNSFWTKTYVSVTGGQTDPSGGTGAYKLTETTDNADHRFYHLFPTAPTGEVTYSFYVKYIGRQWIYLRTKDGTGTNRHIWFDIQNGIAGTAETNVTGTISASGNGFYKITVTVASGISGGQSLVIGGAAADGDGAGYTGSGADAFAFWGINMSTLGETTLNETSGQIHRAYAPTLQTAAINAPRLEYSPTDSASDGQSMGILIEGQAQNLIERSDSIDNGYWVKGNVSVTAAAAVGVTGALNACLVTESAEVSPATNYHEIFSGFIYPTSASSCTVSLYCKSAGVPRVRLLTTAGGNSRNVVYDIINGTVIAETSATGAVESVGNGFFRISMTYTAPTTGGGRLYLTFMDASSNVFYTGNGYNSVITSGFMFEMNSFPSSFISSNSGSATTRASESLSMTDSSLFDNGEGTIVAEYDTNNPSAVAGIAAITDGTGSSNAVSLRLQASTAKLFVNNAGSTQAAASTTAPSAGVSQKIAGRYAVNDFGVSVNGGSVVADANGTVPVISKLEIGTMDNGSYHLNGHVKRVAIYPALTDTNLQALTS